MPRFHNRSPSRRILFALFISVLIHVLVVDSPGWGLSFTDAVTEAPATLEARLVAPRLQPVLKKPSLPPIETAQPIKPLLKNAVLPPVINTTPSSETTITASQGTSSVEVRDEIKAPAQPALNKTEMAWPKQGRVRFTVTRGEADGNKKPLIIGQSVQSWQHDETTYSMQTVTETTGLIAFFKSIKIAQYSEGAIGENGLLPREFRVERSGVLAEGARFDRETKRVLLTEAGVTRKEELLAVDSGGESGDKISQDMVSQIYQLGLMDKPARVEMMIATGKKYALFTYELVGEERLSTSLGELNTLHYRTVSAPGEDRYEQWLATDYINLPVRIRYLDRKGDIYDQVVTEIEIDGKRTVGRVESSAGVD